MQRRHRFYRGLSVGLRRCKEFCRELLGDLIPSSPNECFRSRPSTLYRGGLGATERSRYRGLLEDPAAEQG